MKLLDQYRGLRREIYVLFFGSIVTNLGSMIWPVLTLILSQKLHFSAAEISYYFVGSSIIMLPADLIGGKLADRFNKKKLIVICDSVSILCFIVCAAIPLGIGTILLFVLAGVFQSIEAPAYDALCADLSTTKDRERAFSLMYLGCNLGLVLSPTIAGLLLQDFLWLSFLISGLSIAVSTVLIAVLIKDITPVEDTGEEAAYQEKKDGVSVFKVLIKNPLLLFYIFAGTLYGAVYGQYCFILPLDLAAVHGEAGAVLYGTLSSLNCIAVVVFTPLITKIFAKMRDTGKMLTGRILVFSGYVRFLLLLVLLRFVPGYYLAMLIFTWGEIFSTIAAGPYVSTRVPASHRGRINGLISVGYVVVAGFADISAGQIYDRAGSSWTWVFILSLTLISGAMVVILKALDKKAYPKLYGSKETKESGAPDGCPADPRPDEG